MTASACPTPLEEWLAAPEPGREIELKHLVDPTVVPSFRAAIEAHCVPEVHEASRPVAFTRTTYLDTHARDYFRSTAPRRRLRIREYAAAATVEDEPLLTGVCCLELKESADGIRRKVRWQGPIAAMRRVARGEVPMRLGAPGELLERVRVDRPLPVATTWYRRRAFTGPHGVRITIDDPPWLCRPVEPGSRGTSARPPDLVAVLARPIVEVKLAGPMPEWLQRAVALLPPARSVSKFRLAVSVL